MRNSYKFQGKNNGRQWVMLPCFALANVLELLKWLRYIREDLSLYWHYNSLTMRHGKSFLSLQRVAPYIFELLTHLFCSLQWYFVPFGYFLWIIFLGYLSLLFLVKCTLGLVWFPFRALTEWRLCQRMTNNVWANEKIRVLSYTWYHLPALPDFSFSTPV